MCVVCLLQVKSELEGQASKAANEAKSCSNLLAQVQTELDQQKSVVSEASSCKASLQTVSAVAAMVLPCHQQLSGSMHVRAWQ